MGERVARVHVLVCAFVMDVPVEEVPERAGPGLEHYDAAAER